MATTSPRCPVHFQAICNIDCVIRIPYRAPDDCATMDAPSCPLPLIPSQTNL